MGILNRHWILASLAVLAVGLAGMFLATRDAAPVPKKPAIAAEEAILAPDDQVHAGYAGSESCKKCHAAAFEKWQGSHHGLAERAVSKEEDYKAFIPKNTLVHGKESSETFVDADGLAKILTEGLDKKRHAYQVVRVIGEDPLRQFLIAAPGGRMQACDVTLDPAKNEWFDVFGNDDAREAGDWGHWTGQGMNWNSMCAACHNTRLRKNYEPQTNSYHTTMAEMSVSCEACHGPMKAHADWQEKPHGKDPTLAKFSRDRAMETCAACHARRAELTGDLVPGASFHDHFSLTIPDQSDTFYPDGQVHEEDYEFTAFLSSKMQHAGVRCADCHDPHTGKPIAEGNPLCMNCHAGGRADFPTAPVIDPAAHSHHGVESTGNQCVSCHMPVTTYMQRDPRHDHGFTIPDPALTQETGTPNACNRCHTDKDTDWAVSSYRTLFGEIPFRATHTRALLIASARRGDPAAREGLIALLASEPIPLWRASACLLLGRWASDPAVLRALTGKLADESPLVREAAVRTLAPLDETVKSTIRPLLEDVTRAVRIAAAWALCEDLDTNSRAGRELVHMLDLNADQPTGRMQLAQFAMRRGDTPAAIRQMRKAIAWDANSPPFHHDLAIALSTSGDSAGAVAELREAIRLDPQNADYHYTVALALNENGDAAASTAELETTVRLDPQYAKAWYNLGLARSAANQPKEAIDALRKGETADPGDAAIPYARATVHARLGQKNEALEAASRALQIRPDFPEALRLVQMLAR